MVKIAELWTNSIRIKRQTLASDHAYEQYVIRHCAGRSTILKIYSARITAAISLHTVAATVTLSDFRMKLLNSITSVGFRCIRPSKNKTIFVYFWSFEIVESREQEW